LTILGLSDRKDWRMLAAYGQELRSPNSALTCTAGTLGAPQISLPLGEVDGLPVGLSLLGARGSDEMLLNFARNIATAFDAKRT
jgi:Asp-tRNA(Asn)/Glu-tRNA(Gln) amidotransferase A subunit family amidase